jgi:hypothetical protein
MRNVILSALALLALASALVFASAAGAGKSSLVVAMRDPGCHWFQVGGKYTKTAVRSGAVVLVNQDEAALKVKGPNGTKFERVGGKLTLRAKGVYRITMVKQARDDNHLKLTIK